MASADPDLVVALDFSFGFPAWFLDELGAATSVEAWDAIDERWLAMAAPPFWGRAGRPCPVPGELAFRATEAAMRPRPKSVFQVGGAGAVGTASLRGMPVLSDLRKAGFSVWPFDHPPRPPVLVEGWPRACAPFVRRSRLVAPDAFDAWLLAYALEACWDPSSLPAPSEVEAREGRIWAP